MTGPVLWPKLVADYITAEWHHWRKDVFNKLWTFLFFQIRTGFELKCLVLFYLVSIYCIWLCSLWPHFPTTCDDAGKTLMDGIMYWAARSPVYLDLCGEISSIALLWPLVLLLALSLRYPSLNGINAVDSSQIDVWHMVTQDECWLFRIYFSFLTFSEILLYS